jgi:hypothetical protein
MRIVAGPSPWARHRSSSASALRVVGRMAAVEAPVAFKTYHAHRTATCLAQVAWSSLADVCMAAVMMEGTLLPHRRACCPQNGEGGKRLSSSLARPAPSTLSLARGQYNTSYSPVTTVSLHAPRRGANNYSTIAPAWPPNGRLPAALLRARSPHART